MKTNQEKLDAAIQSMIGIKNTLADIKSKNEKIFKGNRGLNKSYKDVIDKINISIDRLSNPVLSIAMVGTTSAGKSTIVNALAGRTIAPMESEEMSAGVLKLIPDSKIILDITESPNWEYGRFENITDKEAYKKIATIYYTYQRFEKITTPPEILVQGPLLWANHPELIGIPDNLSIEFIDLPGLKTLTDNKNLAVIQKHLLQSVCIVSMDYNDVDPKRIERLLEELEGIVKSLSGNDDSILFLLNKVDSRSKTDKKISERINDLTERIKNQLPLKENAEIKILPFIARLLYYAQNAINTSFYTDKEITYNYEMIGYMISDHANAFNLCSSQTKEVFDRVSLCYENRFDEYGDDYIEMIHQPQNEDVKYLIKECYQLSHANLLLAELKRRIQDSFAAVVIQPAIYSAFKALDVFIEKMSTFIYINQNDSSLSLLNDQLGLIKRKFTLVGSAAKKDDNGNISDGIYKSLIKDLGFISDSLNSLELNEEENTKVKHFLLKEIVNLKKHIEKRPIGEIDKKLNTIESNTISITNKIVELSVKKGNFQKEIFNYLVSIKGNNSSVDVFGGLIDVPGNIKEKLDIQILRKIKQSLETGDGKGKLGEELAKQLAVQMFSPILPTYEAVCSTFKAWDNEGYTRENSNYVIKRKSVLTENELKAVNDMYTSFNRRIRELLTRRTNLLFQIESKQFIEVMNNFIKKEVDDIISILSNNLGSEAINLAKYIETLLENTENTEITLPDTLFEFSKPNFNPDTLTIKKQVYDGMEAYTVGSCCPKTKTRSKYKTVNDYTYIYKFPDQTGLYNAWSSGINESETLFWIVLADWMNITIKKYMSLLSEISIKAIDEINKIAENRIAELQQSNTERFSSLEDIKEELKKMDDIRIKLKETIL